MTKPKFEAVTENKPKTAKVLTRGPNCNEVELKLQKPGHQTVAAGSAGLGVLLGFGGCTGLGAAAIASGAEGGTIVLAGFIGLIGAVIIWSWFLGLFFKKTVILKIEPDVIHIDGKAYDPALFEGFTTDIETTESGGRTPHVTTTTTLAWWYGGQVVRLKAGFNGPLAGEAVRWLNSFVAEIHPNIKD